MTKYPHGLKEAQIRAKRLLKALQSGSPEQVGDALDILRLHPFHAKRRDEEILSKAAEVPLVHMQHGVARSWNFADWKALLSAYGKPLSQKEQRLLEEVLELRGRYQDGWTEDDVAHFCSILSNWIGTDIGCVWDFYDSWGASGSSDLHSIHVVDGHLRVGAIPPGLWAFLLDGDESVDPMSFRGASLSLDETETRAPSVVGDYNYAWAVQGAHDENLLFFSYAGLQVFQTIWESASARISSYHYEIEGSPFDVRDLMGTAGMPEESAFKKKIGPHEVLDEEEYHKAVIRRAIDTGLLRASGLSEAPETGSLESGMTCLSCGHIDTAEEMREECPACGFQFQKDFLVTLAGTATVDDVDLVERVVGQQASSVDRIGNGVDVLFRVGSFAFPAETVAERLREKIRRLECVMYGEEVL